MSMKRQVVAVLALSAMSVIAAPHALAMQVRDDPTRASPPQQGTGQIDAVDLGKRVLVISGRTYSFFAVKVPVHDGAREMDPARLAKGMMVRFSFDKTKDGQGAITEIWLEQKPQR
jgi:hypothetical protein